MQQELCDTGKLTFLKYSDARDTLVSLNKRKKGNVRIYKCDRCGHFHMTTVSKMKKQSSKIDKYPIKVDLNKKKVKPFKPHQYKNGNNYPPVPETTQKAISSKQAEILKHIIEAKNNIK